jgi:hypothetical protein
MVFIITSQILRADIKDLGVASLYNLAIVSAEFENSLQNKQRIG